MKQTITLTLYPLWGFIMKLIDFFKLVIINQFNVYFNTFNVPYNMCNRWHVVRDVLFLRLINVSILLYIICLASIPMLRTYVFSCVNYYSINFLGN